MKYGVKKPQLGKYVIVDTEDNETFLAALKKTEEDKYYWQLANVNITIMPSENDEWIPEEDMEIQDNDDGIINDMLNKQDMKNYYIIKQLVLDLQDELNEAVMLADNPDDDDVTLLDSINNYLKKKGIFHE